MVVEKLALGYEVLLSDYYWILGINYFGDARNRFVSYGELYNYLDLVVSLDPNFRYAYVFGGNALPWNQGHGWVNTKQAAILLERGIKQFPKDWELRFQLAYCYSAYLSRFKDAGDQLAAASVLPGAPSYLAPLATRMYATTNDFEAARSLSERLLAETQDPDARAALQSRLSDLRLIDETSSIQQAIKACETQLGRIPNDLQVLADVCHLTPVPAADLNQFDYDPSNGKVTSYTMKQRAKIFVHPRDK